MVFCFRQDSCEELLVEFSHQQRARGVKCDQICLVAYVAYFNTQHAPFPISSDNVHFSGFTLLLTKGLLHFKTGCGSLTFISSLEALMVEEASRSVRAPSSYRRGEDDDAAASLFQPADSAGFCLI